MFYDRQYHMAYEVVGGRFVPRYTSLYSPAYSDDQHDVLAPISYNILANILYLTGKWDQCIFFWVPHEVKGVLHP